MKKKVLVLAAIISLAASGFYVKAQMDEIIADPGQGGTVNCKCGEKKQQRGCWANGASESTCSTGSNCWEAHANCA